MSHVFISYNVNDTDFADKVKSELEKAGLETWLDTDKLRGGTAWREEIDQAIRDALALVLVMTPEAMQSAYVNYEWAFALGAGVKVIPVLLKPGDHHSRLDALQYLDFSQPRNRPWDKLIAELQKTADVRVTIRVARDAPPAIKKAVEAFDSPNEAERLSAIESLAQMSHPAAREALAQAVQHPIRDVRIHAAFALTQFKDTRAVPGLVEALSDEKSLISDTGLRLLQQIEDPDGLLRVHRSIFYVFYAAGWALGQIGDASAVPYLIEFLHNNKRHSMLRKITAWALGQIKDTTAIPCLLEALGDEGLGVADKAIEALGRIGRPAIPGLLEVLDHKSPQVRENAAKALGKIGDNSVVQKLVSVMFYDENDDVREAAISALGEIRDTSVVPDLIKVLNKVLEWHTSTGYHMKEAIILALKQIGNPEALAIVEEEEEKREMARRYGGYSGETW